MDNREQILGFIKAKGPVLPIQISKELNTNTIMAGAHLAELTATKKLKVSTLKIGGSPLYFLAGQETMLEKYAVNLNEKEKRAFDLLKENSILRDRELPALMRVALREIKDFAIELNVNYSGNREIFWKWHSLINEEAEPLIKSKLNIIEKEELKHEPEIKKDTRSEAIEKQHIEEKAEKKKEVQKELKPRKQKEKDDSFMNDVSRFFAKNSISVISSEIVKKNTEIDFIIEIPSIMGNLKYYCKAKNKKKINDSDLSGAYVKGQFRKMPVIVISGGDLSPKAQQMLEKELNTLTFKKI